jgi:hypothetical protein
MVHRNQSQVCRSLWIAALQQLNLSFGVKLSVAPLLLGQTYRCTSFEQISVEFTAYQWNGLDYESGINFGTTTHQYRNSGL